MKIGESCKDQIFAGGKFIIEFNATDVWVFIILFAMN